MSRYWVCYLLQYSALSTRHPLALRCMRSTGCWFSADESQFWKFLVTLILSFTFTNFQKKMGKGRSRQINARCWKKLSVIEVFVSVFKLRFCLNGLCTRWNMWTFVDFLKFIQLYLCCFSASKIICSVLWIVWVKIVWDV